MPGPALTMMSKLYCPHGGLIVPRPTSLTLSDGNLLLTAADGFQIVGCPFLLPSLTPSPCVEVRWIVPPLRAKAGGGAMLCQTDIGICSAATRAPQGPVRIEGAPSRVIVP